MLMRALLVDFPANAALSAIHTTSFMITLASLGTRMDIGFMLISRKGFPAVVLSSGCSWRRPPELRDVAPSHDLVAQLWGSTCYTDLVGWNDGLLHKGWSCPVRTDLCDWMQVFGLRSCSSHNVGPSQEWACSKGSNWGAKTTTSRGAWSDVILSSTTGLAQIGPLLGYSVTTDGPCQIPQP